MCASADDHDRGVSTDVAPAAGEAAAPLRGCVGAALQADTGECPRAVRPRQHDRALRGPVRPGVAQARNGDTALAKLQAEFDRVRRTRGTFRGWLAGLGLLYVAGIAFAWALAPVVLPVVDYVPEPEDLYLVFVAWSYLILRLGMSVAESPPAAEESAVVERLIALRGPDALPLLLRAYGEGDHAFRQAAARALLRLLPRLKASDAKHITPEAMWGLLDLLSAPDDQLVLATLVALRQVGDGRAVGPLQDLLARPTRLRTRVEVFMGRVRAPNESPLAGRVERAARECLEFVLERREAEKAAALLLRPAETPDAEMLLRPADAGPESRPETLLRPAGPSPPSAVVQAGTGPKAAE